MGKFVAAALKAALAQDPNLPALPDHVRRLLELLKDESVPLPALAREVEQDPAITLRVLRLANSAMYGQTREVTTLDRALSVIGVSEIPSMLAGIASVESCERFLSNQRFNWKEFWGHCSGTAFIASSLVRQLKIANAGPDFLGGLLHDIGYLALAKFDPARFDDAVAEAYERHGFLAGILEERFGITRQDAGSILADASKLAGELKEVITYVHQPSNAPKRSRLLVGLVSLANEFAHLIGLTFFRGTADTEVVISELPAWKILAEARPEILDWDVARVLFELEREYRASECFVRVARAS